MLKLELVRFKFTPLFTCGVLLDPDGWCCLTGESVVLNTLNPPKGKAALAEGIYQVQVVSPAPNTWLLTIHDVESEPPLAWFSAEARAALAAGHVCIGFGCDVTTGVLSETKDALHVLLHHIRKEGGAYVSIRHLDYTQLRHFERMALEAVQ